MFGMQQVCLQGDLSSLSAQLEVCVVPVLMYDSENWILNMLESFLAEVGKRILKLPEWGSNSAVMTVRG